MAAVHVHQICYSQDVKGLLDPGFTPLDYLDNERPDWMEYWPIRKWLLASSMNEDDYYGFFSPRFTQKTRLSGAAVKAFVTEQAGDADVVIFSPFLDQCAFFQNVFEQGGQHHKGMADVTRACLRTKGIDVDFKDLVNDTRNTIFCNYFLAKPSFWKVWLEMCEIVFAIVEGGEDELKGRLSGGTDYKHGTVPMKVFIIERMASLILATQPGWTTKAYNPYLLPRANSRIAKMTAELMTCDALKIAYASTKLPPYLQAFYNTRAQMLRAVNARGDGAQGR